MTNIGFVREINKNMAKVRFLRESACGGNCSSCGGCKSKPVDRWIENTLNVDVGDKVEVKSDSGKILKSAFVLYIIPLIVFFAGYFITSLFCKELVSSLAGVLLFFMSFIIARKYGSNLNIEFEMIKKVNS